MFTIVTNNGYFASSWLQVHYLYMRAAASRIACPARVSVLVTLGGAFVMLLWPLKQKASAPCPCHCHAWGKCHARRFGERWI